MENATNMHYPETKDNVKTFTERYAEALGTHRSIIANAQLAQSAIYEMGKGLQTMRDDKLYKELGYNNFENYCQQEFQLGKVQAYKYISIVENLSDNFVHSSERFGVTKLALLATLPSEELQEVTNVVDVNEISVKELKERIKELEGKVDTVTQDKAKSEAEVQALSNVNSKLTEKSRTLESKVYELESKPTEVAVQEVIVPNEEYEVRIKALQEEYTQKLQQLKQDNKTLTKQVQNSSEDSEKLINYKAALQNAEKSIHSLIVTCVSCGKYRDAELMAINFLGKIKSLSKE